MTKRHWGPLGTLAVFISLLGAGTGCDDNENLGTSCFSSANCNVAQGSICCGGQCHLAANCESCATPPMDVSGDWQWAYICKDAAGNCPVKTVNTTMTVTMNGAGVTAVPVGEDTLGGAVCNDAVEWAEAVAGGSDQGCWTFNAAVDQFNQRSWGEDGARLCLGVGARVGTALPALPVCADLTGDFFSCPAAPPGAP